MDAKLKNKWIDALISGDYKQGKTRLRSVDNEYCCLGVLCDIVNPNHWVSPSGDAVPYEHGGQTSSGLMPLPLLSEVGLSDSQQRALAQMNDDDAGFLEIALHIDQNF